LERTYGVEVDLDGGVTTRVEDLKENRKKSRVISHTEFRERVKETGEWLRGEGEGDGEERRGKG
jgi:hypothetical protein